MSDLLGKIREYFYYHKESPTNLKWKKNYRRNKKDSNVIGKNLNGVFFIRFDEKYCQISKILLIINGYDFDMTIDSVYHIDKNAGNFELSNLELVYYNEKVRQNEILKTRDWNKIFEYRNGILYWKIDRFKGNKLCTRCSVKGEKVLLSEGEHGHLRLSIQCGKMSNTYVHRLIYEMFYGKDSVHGYEIDHINGDPKDNKIENLRLADRHLNGRNQKMTSRNKSGVTGVHYCKITNSFIASWVSHEDGKQKHRRFNCKKYGCSTAKQMAIAAREDEMRKLAIIYGEKGYTERHGLKEE